MNELDKAKASKTIYPSERNSIQPSLLLNMGEDRKLKFHKYCIGKGGMTKVLNEMIDKLLKK